MFNNLVYRYNQYFISNRKLRKPMCSLKLIEFITLSITNSDRHMREYFIEDFELRD